MNRAVLGLTPDRFVLRLVAVVVDCDCIALVRDQPGPWQLPGIEARAGANLVTQLREAVEHQTGITASLEGPVSIISRPRALTIAFLGSPVLDMLTARWEVRWVPIEGALDDLTLGEVEAIGDSQRPWEHWPVLRPRADVHRRAERRPGSLLHLVGPDERKSQSPVLTGGNSATSMSGPAT